MGAWESTFFVGFLKEQPYGTRAKNGEQQLRAQKLKFPTMLLNDDFIKRRGHLETMQRSIEKMTYFCFFQIQSLCRCKIVDK